MITTTNKTQLRALRAALRARFGARRYRITRDAEIHVYGQMPNTNIVGWWFFGYVEDRGSARDLGLA